MNIVIGKPLINGNHRLKRKGVSHRFFLKLSSPKYLALYVVHRNSLKPKQLL
ncbi:MAG: hypothetical protein LBJ41_03735 [Treponema sp.]|jgi:hypothetical protein|nr:hypothetical protein [Treponema sp.]